MKKRALFFDCFYSFSSLLFPLSLSRLHSLSSKSNKLAKSKSKANVKIHSYLYTSAINGQLNAILFFVHYKDKLGATYLNSALAYAAHGGHLDICSFSYFIQIGATNFNLALQYAAEGGHKDLCSFSYFIMLGATDLDWALVNAKDQTTKDFLKRLRTK